MFCLDFLLIKLKCGIWWNFKIFTKGTKEGKSRQNSLDSIVSYSLTTLTTGSYGLWETYISNNTNKTFPILLSTGEQKRMSHIDKSQVNNSDDSLDTPGSHEILVTMRSLKYPVCERLTKIKEKLLLIAVLLVLQRFFWIE